MNRIEAVSERALELASTVGSNVRHALPRAGELLDAGAKLAVLKKGAGLAGKFVRRNPVIVAAAVAGAGLLWYVAHRRAKRAERDSDEHATIEGSARRVEARRAPRTTRAGTRSGSRSRTSPSAHT